MDVKMLDSWMRKIHGCENVGFTDVKIESLMGVKMLESWVRNARRRPHVCLQTIDYKRQCYNFVLIITL